MSVLNTPLEKLDARLQELKSYEPFTQQLLAEQPEIFKDLSTKTKNQALQVAFTLFGVTDPIRVAYGLPMETSLDWLQELQDCFSANDPLPALHKLSGALFSRRDPVPVLASALVLNFELIQPEMIRVGLEALMRHIAEQPTRENRGSALSKDEKNGCSWWLALEEARERAELGHEERRSLLHHLLTCKKCYCQAAGFPGFPMQRATQQRAPQQRATHASPLRIPDAKALTADPFVMVLRRLQTAQPERLRAAHREALEEAREQPSALLYLLLEEALQIVYASKDFSLEVMGLVMELLHDFRLPLVDAEKRNDLLALAEFYLAEAYRLLQQEDQATKALERGQEARKQGTGNSALKATFYQISARLRWAELYPGASAERLLLEAEQYLFEDRHHPRRVEVLHELAGVWIGQQRFGKARGVLCKAKALLDAEEATEVLEEGQEQDLAVGAEQEAVIEAQEVVPEGELAEDEEEKREWPLLRLVNYHNLAVVELGVAEKTTREPQRQVCLRRASGHLGAAETLYKVYGSLEFREERDCWLKTIERLSSRAGEASFQKLLADEAPADGPT